MIGGLLKSASRLALVAAAGVLVGGVSAQAADLGGDCCADLEERVADLEATTVRKGNRKVSLQISGQVNQMVMFWDDGRESNTYVTNNEHSSTRFRFLGSAKIDAKWSAGYYLEWENWNEARSSLVNQGGNDFNGTALTADDPQNLNAPFSLRHSAWYIQNADYGQLWVGHTSTATDGITYINLANSNIVAFSKSQLINNGFRLRSRAAGGRNDISGLNWGNIRPQGNGGDITLGRQDIVKYVSPTLAGFVFSASWGEDDAWDTALRYAGEFSGIKIAAGVGYAEMTDDDMGCADVNANAQSGVNCSQWNAGLSLMHVPTGLFLTGSYGERSDDRRNAVFGRNVDSTDTAWHLQGGIEQKWLSIGKTTLVGEYGVSDAGAGLDTGAIRELNANDPLRVGLGAGFLNIASSEVTVWGVGLVQSIDAAAMDLYLSYRNYSADVTLLDRATGATTKSNAIEDFSVIMAGGIIKF